MNIDTSFPVPSNFYQADCSPIEIGIVHFHFKGDRDNVIKISGYFVLSNTISAYTMYTLPVTAAFLCLVCLNIIIFKKSTHSSIQIIIGVLR